MAKKKEKSMADKVELLLPSIMNSLSIGVLIVLVSRTLVLVPMFSISKPYFAAITILIAPMLYYKYIKEYGTKNSFLFGLSMACPLIFSYLLLHEQLFLIFSQSLQGQFVVFSIITYVGLFVRNWIKYFGR